MTMKSFYFFSRIWHSYVRLLRHYWIASGIFILGTVISLIIFQFYRQQEQNRLMEEFNHFADTRLFVIKEILEGTIDQLEYGKHLYSVFQEISENEFHTFFHYSLDLYPNISLIGWITPRSNPANTHHQRLPFSDLHSSSAPPAHHYPVTFLEKNHPEESLIIDKKNYSDFLKDIRQSRHSPSIISSKAVEYLQGTKKTGFFMMASITEKTAYRGTLIGLSNFEDIFNQVQDHLNIGLNIAIYDLTGGLEHLLYRYGAFSNNEELPQTWVRSHHATVGSNVWKLKATPATNYMRLHSPWKYWEIPVFGILISGLTTFYFLTLVNRRIFIEQEVQKRTEELTSMNRILQNEIQERARVEEEIVRGKQLLQKRHEALEYLTKFTSSELQNGINEVILRTSSVLQVDRVSIWFYEIEDSTPILACQGLYTLSTNSFSDHLQFSSAYFPHYFQALAAHSHVIIPSPEDNEINQELSSYLAAFHIISKLDIPIVFEGRSQGVLCCEETRGHREWQLEDRHFGQNIADIIAIMIEQSGRRKAEKALQESEERVHFITQKAIDGILSVNDKGEVMSWNYGAEQMFGYTEHQMMGQLITQIIPYYDFNTDETALKPVELIAKDHNGHVFPAEISHTRWKSGHASYDTIIIRDITERKEYEKRLIKALKDAKAASEAKTDFLTTISHELRTPLNAIIGFDQCLLMGMDGPLNDQQQATLQKIEKSSFHLLTLINDLLDLAKIEANKMEMEIASHDIVETIKSCIEEIQPMAEQKNLSLRFDIPLSFLLIEIDAMRIRQVLLNLLTNAVKFTEQGTITVSLRDHPEFIEIDVSDTGIGLSDEELSKIFRPFTQADSSITRKYGGTGLGLVISKKIIDLHGGKISVKSEKGKGSTFSVALRKERTL